MPYNILMKEAGKKLNILPGPRNQWKEIKSHKICSRCQRSYTRIFCILYSRYGTLNSFLYEVLFSYYGILEILFVLRSTRADVLLKRAMSICPMNVYVKLSFFHNLLVKGTLSSTMSFREIFFTLIYRV